MTPGDGIAHRLLARRQVAGAVNEQRQPVVESGQQEIWLEDFDPRCGEFDGKGQPIEPGANLRNRRSILRGQDKAGANRLGLADEQRDRRILGKLGRGYVRGYVRYGQGRNRRTRALRERAAVRDWLR